MLTAGTCDQVAAWLDHLHGTQVDFFVATGCTGNSGTSFRKCRRIKDDHVILDAIPALLPKQIEGIGLYKVHTIL